MKLTTQIVLGIRQVGDQKSDIFIESMTVHDAMRKIAETLMMNPLHNRIQIAIGRAESQVKIGLQLGTVSRQLTRAANAMSVVDSLFDGLEINEQDEEI